VLKKEYQGKEKLVLNQLKKAATLFYRPRPANADGRRDISLLTRGTDKISWAHTIMKTPDVKARVELTGQQVVDDWKCEAGAIGGPRLSMGDGFLRPFETILGARTFAGYF